MKQNIGFIGCGNMAKALINGMIQTDSVNPENIIVSNPSMPKLNEVREKFNINITQNNITVAENSDVVFLSVKPNKYTQVIEEIRNYIREDTIIVNIAAGVSIAECEQFFNRQTKIVKAMPNTPVAVGAGMIALSFNKTFTNKEKEKVELLFNSFSKTVVIDESLMDIEGAIGGSAPAFVYVFIEALADSAVMYGMPRDMAYRIVAQTVLGAAKMVLESGEHPAKLKDDVCSPYGTTIQSIASLEEHGFRNAIIQAVKANLNKLNS
jgi:pyrroline-5-carboxylate reductase